jgi:hypothetical protein
MLMKDELLRWDMSPDPLRTVLFPRAVEGVLNRAQASPASSHGRESLHSKYDPDQDSDFEKEQDRRVNFNKKRAPSPARKKGLHTSG